MVRFVQNNHLKSVTPYLYNIAIFRKDQADYDTNRNPFLDAARKTKLKFNNSKSVFSTRRLPLLRYVIEKRTFHSDPDRLRPLLEFPLP